MTVTTTDEAAPDLPTIPLAGGVAQVAIDGQPISPAAACEHRTWLIETVVGLREDDGRVVGRQLQVRAVCSGCPAVARFDPTSAEVNPDGTHAGVWFEVEA